MRRDVPTRDDHARREARWASLLFEHVPAQVCAACGEVWIDDATLRDIDRLIREGKPARKVETPIYDFDDFAGAASR